MPDPLDPAPALAARPALLAEAARLGGRYLTQSAVGPVYPSPNAVADLAALGGPLPESPEPPQSVLALLDRYGSPATVASAASGRYFGFVTGGALPAALAANVLAAAWDQNASLTVMSPVAAYLEQVTLAWLTDLLGLPPTAAGAFVTGATMANFTALAAARHALLARQGWDVEANGLFGAPEFPVVVGEESHVSVRKALSLLGLGRARVTVAPTDGQGRLRADALPPLDRPGLICIQAGNVNTGASDPIQAVCAHARRSGSWVHVDGAFGLWAAAAPARAAQLAGLAEADSWATDAHKWLNVPYDCGLAFVADSAALRDAMAMHAAYLAADGLREPMHTTPESSRRARGIEVWAALRSLGRTGLAEMIERSCRQAAHLAACLSAAGCEVRNQVTLNQVLVSFGSDARTAAVLAAIQSSGECWCGGTVWQGRQAVRISVSSWATTDADIERTLAAILAADRATPPL